MRGTFLESDTRYSNTCDFCFIGIKCCSADYLLGVEKAADKIRELSYRYANADSTARPLKVYSPEEGYILKDTNLLDYGNVEAKGLSKLKGQLEKMVYPFYATPIFVGGDHGVTYELIKKACGKIYKDVVVVQFDAHSDYIDEYEEYPHGSVMNEVNKLACISKIIHFGIRGNLNSDPAIRNSKKAGNMVVPYYEMSKLYGDVIESIKDKYVYITFDTDFLNPACAPATNCPEPGGPNYEEALRYLKDIIAFSKKIIGMDFVEYNPTCEGAILTGTTIVNLIMESLHYMTKKDTTS